MGMGWVKAQLLARLGVEEYSECSCELMLRLFVNMRKTNSIPTLHLTALLQFLKTKATQVEAVSSTC